MMPALVDPFGRRIEYLRISVTDRCNLACIYCMPGGKPVWRPRDEILRFEEIRSVAQLAAEYGVRKIRLTGGEPLVRRDLPELVYLLTSLPYIEEVSLTTNAVLLEKMAAELKDAGLRRINVSLDTLQAEKYARITRGGSIEQVWRGLQAADKLGFSPLKMNVVAMRGINDDEFLDMAELSRRYAWHVRFIELMPVSGQPASNVDIPAPEAAYISSLEIQQMLAQLGLQPVGAERDSGPAREYTMRGEAGRIGFISPLSDRFCQACNRLRITADGAFRPCLLQDGEVPFLAALRAGEPVLPLLQKAVASKPHGHDLAMARPALRCMRQIGG